MATTHSPQPVASNGLLTATHSAHDTESSLRARVLSWFTEFYCGLHGHDNLMQFEKERVFLQCASCGHETPGWALSGVPPRIVVRGDARRHKLARPRLITARRIA